MTGEGAAGLRMRDASAGAQMGSPQGVRGRRGCGNDNMISHKATETRPGAALQGSKTRHRFQMGGEGRGGETLQGDRSGQGCQGDGDGQRCHPGRKRHPHSPPIQ